MATESARKEETDEAEKTGKEEENKDVQAVLDELPDGRILKEAVVRIQKVRHRPPERPVLYRLRRKRHPLSLQRRPRAYPTRLPPHPHPMYRKKECDICVRKYNDGTR